MNFVTEEGAYEKVQSGEWTFAQFDRWMDQVKAERYCNGYSQGYSDANDGDDYIVPQLTQ